MKRRRKRKEDLTAKQAEGEDGKFDLLQKGKEYMTTDWWPGLSLTRGIGLPLVLAGGIPAGYALVNQLFQTSRKEKLRQKKRSLKRQLQREVFKGIDKEAQDEGLELVAPEDTTANKWVNRTLGAIMAASALATLGAGTVGFTREYSAAKRRNRTRRQIEAIDKLRKLRAAHAVTNLPVYIDNPWAQKSAEEDSNAFTKEAFLPFALPAIGAGMYGAYRAGKRILPWAGRQWGKAVGAKNEAAQIADAMKRNPTQLANAMSRQHRMQTQGGRQPSTLAAKGGGMVQGARKMIDTEIDQALSRAQDRYLTPEYLGQFAQRLPYLGPMLQWFQQMAQQGQHSQFEPMYSTYWS